jgi:aspartyl-tRNA(Asn)/glutamyl-tRNA(Gln) amidotransferase subunit C
LPISRAEVLKIAELAKLHFSEAELDEFIPQFQKILDYIEQLKEIDVSGLEPTTHVSLQTSAGASVARADEVLPSLLVEESLANAPDPGNGHFRVPKVL